MRVLIVSDYGTPTGGAEHMSFALREGLRARGHEARLLSSSARALPQVPVAADYTCFGTETPLRRILQASNPFASRKLRVVMAEFRPDVVHVRMFLSQLSPLILRPLRDVPALLHVVNYDLICPINKKILPDGSPCRVKQGMICHRSGCMSLAGMARFALQRRLLWRNFDAAFDLVVANSHWTARRLHDDDVRVDEVVWNGVPVTSLRPPLPTQPLVAYAGRLVGKKGVSVLIDAMSRVVRQVPEARLLLAGDGPQRAELEEQARACGLGECVSFLGHLSRQEMERQLAGAWVQVVPSLWEEPFGLVAAEAMMRGTAAVVSNTGGPAEQVIDGQTGYHVPPGDAAALAEALVRILRNRELAEQLGAAGRAHALQNFTEDRVIDRFLELYDRIITARRAQLGAPLSSAAVGAIPRT